MPPHPARVRDVGADARPLERTRELELNDAQRDSHNRENTAETRRPENGLSPQVLLDPQRSEVEPVRDRRDPGESSACPSGQQYHLSRFRRHVELSTLFVVDAQLVKRELCAL